MSTKFSCNYLAVGLVVVLGTVVTQPAPALAQCNPQELAKLIASDAAANDELGISVAVSGDTAVVGTAKDDHHGGAGGLFNAEGSAYVFVRTGGVWTQQAKLIASDAAEGEQFGYSVAISGDTVVIGANLDGMGTAVVSGAAYVFVKPPGGWSNMTETAKLTASDAANFDEFGISVAVSGETVIVGAWFDDLAGGPGSVNGQGSAYIFVKPPGGWINMTETTKLIASDAAAGDGLGISVSITGDTAVVGAYRNDDGASNSGSAYVFVGFGAVWTQQAKLNSLTPGTSDEFGYSVAVSGDAAIVGAHFDNPGGLDSGSAYVFVRSGAVWNQQAKLSASDPAPTDNFGVSVAISGDTAVVGANQDDQTGSNSGSMYVYMKPPGGWSNMTQTAKVYASDDEAGDQFGVSVAIDNGNAVVGANLEDRLALGNAGAAYVFDLTGLSDLCNPACPEFNPCICNPASCAPATSPLEPGNESTPTAAPSDPCAYKSATSSHPPPDRKTDPVQLFSGQVYETAVDMLIPGRGMDFVWSRTYRSRSGSNTAQGNNWDMSYDVRLAANGANRDVFDGTGRADTYLLQPGGTWARPEFFRQLQQNPDTSYTLTFEDTGKWNFLPLNGSPSQGKISAIIDRNNNTMSFAYDGAGRLTSITDTLGRTITVAYNASNLVQSVTDFAGRQVTYAYYLNGDAGGSAGDLKSVTMPAVNGTPNGNDFPLGKTTTYTYSKGFADARLNGNLLTITDPKGQTFVTNTYAATTNPLAVDFDHAIRQAWGNPTDIIDLVYLTQTPVAGNNYSVAKTILNDRMGNVSEYFYDGLNRLVMLREYTGRAIANQPTTESVNRPTGQLRADDPVFFETRYAYNLDSLVTQITHANGNITRNVYESAINPSALPRARGNLREVHHLPGPLGGDQVEIVETYQYDTATNFVSQFTDGRGNATLYAYDVKGNRLSTTQPIVSVIENWEYNAFGQMTAHILPNNASNHRRRDETTYYNGGPQTGCIQNQRVDSTGLALTTTYQYDAVGNVVSILDPRGHDTLYTVNALNQVARELAREVGGIRYETLNWYDANDNLVRVNIQNRDEIGALQPNTHFSTIYEYDILNMPTRICEEQGSANLANTQLTCASLPAGQFRTTERQYDANRKLALLRFGESVSGGQPNNTVQTLHDERDLVFRIVRSPGDAAQSTTQTDYNGNRYRKAVREGLENAPRVTTFVHDGFNRIISSTDAMGNVSAAHYDASSNTTSQRTDGQLIDVPSGAGNDRLSETTYTYDAMNRQTRSDVAFFLMQTQAVIGDGLSSTINLFADNSQIKRVTDDNGNQTNYLFDTANRLSVVTDAKNNTTTFAYDANSNTVSTTELERSDLGNPNQTFITTFVYDNLDRRTSRIDAIGNVSLSAYDSRGNLSLATDALGRQTRNVFDGLSRLLQTIRDMNSNGPSAGDLIDIVTAQGWDDTDRLISQSDDSGNTTSYSYDALSRKVLTQFADATTNTSTYDVHNNVLTFTDANGSLSTGAFDLLNRLTGRTIAPGAGVANDTTFEALQYNGISLVTSAANNASTVLSQHDSLANVTRETLNGVITQAAYDGNANQVNCTYPGGRAVSSTYDALDRHLAIADGGGSIATYSYFGPDRVERRTHGNATRSDITYDGVAPNPAGDFGVRMPVRITHSSGGGTTILDDRTFTWDRVFNKTRRKDERLAGPRLTHDYTYDAANRLVHTTVRDATNAITRDSSYVLDGVHNRQSVTGLNTLDAGNYLLNSGAPFNDQQVNQYTLTPLGDRTYDANGNLNSYGGCLSGDANADHFVNLSDVPPFIAALLGSGPVVCGVDVNRDGVMNGKDIRPLVDRLTGAVSPSRQFVLRYDYANRMVEFRDTFAPRRNTYAYDALGRRIRKVMDADGVAGGPTETRFFYDGWQEIEEQNSVGATQATYVYGNGIDEVLNMRRGATDSYYHADDLNSIMAVSNSAATIVERYDYQDFGHAAFFNGAGGAIGGTTIGNPLLFTARRFDSESALYYYRTRYFDARAGRFTSRDTIGIWGDPAGLGNGLGYVGNNPMTLTDPMGLEAGYPYKLLPAEEKKLTPMEVVDTTLAPMPKKGMAPPPRPGGPPPTYPKPPIFAAMGTQSGGGGPPIPKKNYNEGRTNTANRAAMPGGGSGGSSGRQAIKEKGVQVMSGIPMPSGKAINETRVQIAFSPAGNDSPSCVCPGDAGGMSHIGSTGQDGDIYNIGSTGNDGVLAANPNPDDDGPSSPLPMIGCGCGPSTGPVGLMFAPVMFIGWKWRMRRRHRRR